jgi:hypothetical protein
LRRGQKGTKAREEARECGERGSELGTNERGEKDLLSDQIVKKPKIKRIKTIGRFSDYF